jgi:hypothetical protein
MKILQKMVIVAMVSTAFSLTVVAMDRQQSVLAFPLKTPGWENAVFRRGNDGILKKYLLIIVPNTRAACAFPDWKKAQTATGLLPEALHEEGAIYFSADGVQPTMEEVAEYSCANVPCTDPNTDPITSWYMQMFGVISFQDGGHYIKAVLDGNTYKKIINYNFLGKLIEKLNDLPKLCGTVQFPTFGKMQLNMVNRANIHAITKDDVKQLIVSLSKLFDMHKGDNDPLKIPLKTALVELTSLSTLMERYVDVDTLLENAYAKFVESFRQIASNKIGRMLLYRLLIEICRKDKDGNGCMEEVVLSNNFVFQDHKIERNLSRIINVALWDKNVFAISLASNKLSKNHATLNFSNADMVSYGQSLINNLTITLRGNPINTFNVAQVGKNKQPQPAFISVFHELLHWFHALRDMKRYKTEKSGNSGKQNMVSNSTLGAFYYFGLDGYGDQARIENTSLPWRNDTTGEYNQEEHRTICGAPLPKLKKQIIWNELIELKGILFKSTMAHIFKESPKELATNMLENLADDMSTRVNLAEYLYRVIGPKFLNGDELSENMLITTLEKKFVVLRNGHAENFEFYEDSKAVKRIAQVAYQNLGD